MRERVWVLLLGAFVFGLNHFWGIARSGSHYTPFSVGTTVSPLEFDASAVYAPGPTVLSTRGQLYADDLFELAGDRLPLPVGHALAVAPLTRLLGPEAGWIMAQALLTGLGLLLLYLELVPGVSSGAAALFLALVCLTLPFGPRNMLLLGGYSWGQPLEYSRLAHPAFSFLLLLAALRLLPRHWLGAGIAIGLLPYTYYYYAASAGLGFALLLVALVAGRRRDEAWRLARALVAAGVVALPYLVILGSRQPVLRQTLLPRLGALTGAPDAAGLALASAATVGVFLLARRRDRARAALLMALLAGAGWGMNLQVLSHFSPQHDHFLHRVVQPIALLLVVSEVFSRWPSFSRRSAAVLASFWIALCCLRQVAAAEKTLGDHQRTRPTYRALAWLRENTDPESVIGTVDNELISLLPGVAGRRTFVPLGQRTAAPDEEILARYLALHKVLGTNWDAIAAAFTAFDSARLWRNLPFQLFLHQGAEPPEVLATMKSRWESLDAKAFLAGRRLDYLLAPADTPTPDCAALSPVQTGQAVRIYRIRHC